MTEIVYLVGAGINQEIKNSYGLSPPMSKNFFRIALDKTQRFAEEYYLKNLEDLFEYIQRYWKKNVEDLKSSEFDIEKCFTLLDKQLDAAVGKGLTETIDRLSNLQFRLKALISELLGEFDYVSLRSDVMREFGKQLFGEKPTILTFNYDCIIEEIVESASRVNDNFPKAFLDPKYFLDEEIPEEIIGWSHCNWNRPLGYGIKFDEVALQQAGPSRSVKADKFYGHPRNQLYSWPILKMHGSLNWFRYLPIRVPNPDETTPPPFEAKESQIILKNGRYWSGMPPWDDGWFIDPVLITPTLYKDKFLAKAPFDQIWSKAKAALASCKKLVTIGYSFSPTDFPTQQLLLESLQDNELDELVVVNPHKEILTAVKDLCHFSKGIEWHDRLGSYLNSS